jgi:multidrug resistance protein, MATE family
MVSKLGTNAIAGVGLGVFAAFASSACLFGIFVAVQAAVARRKGESRESETGLVLNAGLCLGLISALPLAAFLFVVAPSIFGWLSSESAVVSEGLPYYEMRLLGVPAIAWIYAFRGYWMGIGEPARFLRTIVWVHVFNILFSYILIFGGLGLPAMGSAGAGLGSSLAQFAGLPIFFLQAKAHAKNSGFLHSLPRSEDLRRLLPIGFAAGLQQFLMALGLTIMFAIMAIVGANSLAAGHVVITIMSLLFLPGVGFGIASATLAGQALGRGDANEATAVAWKVSKVSGVCLFVVSLPLLLSPGVVLSPFLGDKPEAMSLALAPARLIAASLALRGVGTVLLNSLRGVGAARTTLFVMIGSQGLVQLPLAYILGPVAGFGLLGVISAFVLAGVFQTALVAFFWSRRGWVGIKV